MLRCPIACLTACILAVWVLPARAADDAENKLLGEWWTPVEGIEEGWLIKKTKDDKWKVVVQYREVKTRKILGAFEGRNYEFKDGKLIFKQVWVRKPKSHWGENATMIVESIEDGKKAKMTWKLDNGSKGSRTLEPYARTK